MQSQKLSDRLSSLLISKAKTCIEMFTIELDNNRTIYLPGQRIEGHVALSFNIPTKIRLIRVRVSGMITTQVYKNSSAVGNQLSSMVLFKDYVNLGGTGNLEGELVELGPGESVFPFSFRLPLTALPASFNGAYGKVKYEISAVLMIPGLIKRIQTIPITVPSTISNSNHNFSHQVIAESVLAIKNVFSWEVGHIDIKCTIPKSGFNSEEVIPLTLEITNHSKSPISIQNVCIKEKVTYQMLSDIRGPRTEKIHQLSYSETFGSGIGKITRYIQFLIPSVSIISPAIETPLISVSHVLQITVSSGKRNRKKLTLPFTICGFPWHIFDLDGPAVLEDLPIYEPGSQDGNLRANILSISSHGDELDEVLDSFVDAIITQASESMRNSDNDEDTQINADHTDHLDSEIYGLDESETLYSLNSAGSSLLMDDNQKLEAEELEF